MKTAINNIEITPSIAKVLGRWFDPKDMQKDDSLIVFHINACMELQDFLCEIIAQENNDFPESTIKSLIIGLMSLKRDLKEMFN